MLLRRGMHNADIESLQIRLVELGHMDESVRLTAPGLFGPATERAVIEWEQEHYVSATIDDDEWSALFPAVRPGGTDLLVGQDAVIEAYGRPWDDPADWQRRYLGRADVGIDFAHAIKPRTIAKKRSCYIRCNADVAGSLQVIFKLIAAEGLAREVKSYGGCVNVRMIRGAKGFDAVALNIKGLDALPWSTHTWGLAIDLNAETNGLGVKGDMHPGIVAIFKRLGWIWGGDFKRLDYMHFQRVDGM